MSGIFIPKGLEDFWWSRLYEGSLTNREAAEDAAQAKYEDRADEIRKGKQ